LILIVNVYVAIAVFGGRSTSYVWWDAVGSSGATGGGDASVLVGVDQAAVIQQQKLPT